MPRKRSTPDFEKALAELEALVERMEAGKLPLDELLRDFEHGMQLTRTCQQALDQAEQKVDILLEKGQQASGEPFPAEDQTEHE